MQQGPSPSKLQEINKSRVTSLQPARGEKGRDACFTSMVHYIKLFALPFAGTGQDKHTTAGGRESVFC